MQRHTVTGLVLFVAAAAGLAGALCGIGLADGASAGATAASSEATPAAVVRGALPGIDVLHAWDRRRAHAYATGDEAALRSLYVPGSTVGVRDVRLLSRYERRGYRVEEMRMQVLAVDVLVRHPDRLCMRVTDRLHDAVAVRDGVRVSLPRDQASTRDITLVRWGDGSWRVQSVSASRWVSGGGRLRGVP